MKKLLFLLLTLILLPLSSFAIEEIDLEVEDETEQHINLDYLSDVYYGKVENAPKALKLFSQKGLEFENSPINSVKLSFLYSQHFQYNYEQGGHKFAKHNFFAVEPMAIVKFNDNKSKFMVDYNLVRNLDGYSNHFTEKFSQLYFSHDFTPNQTVLVGMGDRLTNTFDGSKSTMKQEMITKSQLGRTFGERRSVGVRNLAKYKYMDYDIGFYDSTQYMQEFGRGTDVTGSVILKPFAGKHEVIRDFKLGAGYANGHNHISYNMYSAFASYDYKNFHIHSEYANSDGYNAIKESPNKADGFYTLASYKITPKFHLIGRFDRFVENKANSNAYSTEYSAGISYYAFKNLKFMLNFVKKVNSKSADSNMILFATRFIL